MNIPKKQTESKTKTGQECIAEWIAIEVKRNASKAERYRQVINQCCDPECNFGFGLLTHHILPISKGGEDSYSNFIVLCKKCHFKRGNHSADDIRIIELQTYKIYAERLILGFTSKDMSDERFDILIRAKLINQDMPQNASGCPVLDDSEMVACDSNEDEDWAKWSVGGFLDEIDRRYRTFSPIFCKNGKKYLIIEIK